MGWKIEVDPCSKGRYEKSNDAYGRVVAESIVSGDLSYIKLLQDGRCPHLDSDGLCKIVKNLGESYLCDICREHPRFYNATGRGLELGIGAVCEEAARIILSSDSYNSLVELSDIDGAVSCEFDVLQLRNRIYSILGGRSRSYPERLLEIYNKTKVSPSSVSDAEWRELILTLEYMNDADKALFSSFSSELYALGDETDAACERALAYFVYRHSGTAECESELTLALGLAFFLERLFASLIKVRGASEAVSILRTISEEIEYSTDNLESIKLRYL